MPDESPRKDKGHYPESFFRRQDEADDNLFYTEPRLVVHIDEYAIKAIGEYFDEVLPRDGIILDLMSSWRSHLPEGFAKQKLIGLGMNEVELSKNPQLDEWVAHDLNAVPTLPFDDEQFDAAMVTVSIQYMTKPVEVFTEVNRVLKKGSSFHVIYSNRMFPTKAIAAWQALDDKNRAKLISSYFIYSEGWQTPESINISPPVSFYTDPVYVVRAAKE